MRGISMLMVTVLIGASSITTRAADEPKSITVSAQEYRFTPNTVTVRAGQRVKLVLTNRGTVAHEIISPLLKASKDLAVQGEGIKVEGDAFDEIEAAQGKTVAIELTPTKPGRFQFWCGEKAGGKLHRDLGMKGTIVVTK